MKHLSSLYLVQLLLFAVPIVSALELAPSDSAVDTTAAPHSLRSRDSAAAPSIVDLQKLSIVGRKKAYTARASSSGTRMQEQLRDIPQSIQIIPAEVIRDQQAVVLTDVVRNIAGVNQASGGAYNDFAFRGFRSGRGNFAINGQTGGFTDTYAPQTLLTAERVEAIKGPASVLFSAANPGGVINIVTKTPQARKAYEAGFTAGSFDTYRGYIDATGPLAADGRLLYRFIAGAENSGSYRDFIGTRNFTAAPMLAYHPSDRTSLLLHGTLFWQQQDGGGWYDRGILAPEGNLNYVPYSWSGHEPEDKTHDYAANIQADLTHRFSENLSATLLARYGYTDYRQQYHQLQWGSLSNDTLYRTFTDWQAYNKEYSVNAFVAYRTSTGFLKHGLVGGTDISFFGNPATDKGDYEGVNVPPLYAPRPVYGTGDPSSYTPMEDGDVKRDDRLFGAYVQDLIEIHPKLKALVGFRYDWYVHTEDAYWSDAPDTSEASALISRAGLVYQPWIPISLYGGYSESFEPQSSNYPGGGGPFDPERGRQFEAGIKADGKRLSGSAALYQITKYNVLTPDPGNPDRYLQNGEAISYGAELTLQGGIGDLNLLAAYSYNETKTTKNEEGKEVDENFFGAPNNTFSFWAVYRIPEGIFSDVGFGGGMYYVDDKPTFVPGFFIPSYAVFDAEAHYTYRQYRLALKVNNLLDERYFNGGWNYDSVHPGAPRNFQLTAGIAF